MTANPFDRVSTSKSSGKEAINPFDRVGKSAEAEAPAETKQYTPEQENIKRAVEQLAAGRSEAMNYLSPAALVYIPMDIARLFSDKVPDYSKELTNTLAKFSGIKSPEEQSTSDSVLRTAGMLTSDPLAIPRLIKGIPALTKNLFGLVKNFAGKFTKSGRVTNLAKGIVPNQLPSDAYKTFEEQVMPEWFRQSRKQYEEAAQIVNKENDAQFLLEKRNVKAQHERKLYEIDQKNKQTELDWHEAVQEHEAEVKRITNKNDVDHVQEAANVKAKHEAKLYEIEQKNKQAELEFNSANEKYEADVKTAMEEYEIKKNNIDKNNQIELQKFKEAEEEFELIKQRQAEVQSSIKKAQEEFESRSESLFTSEQPKSTQQAGVENTAAIRATAAVDRSNVNKAYQKSDALNAKSVTTHEDLAKKATERLAQLQSVPEPRPPAQQKAINSLKKVLELTNEVDPQGNFIGFKPISSQVLAEINKDMRSFLTYDFAHGDSYNILKPIISDIEDAMEFAARATNNTEAIEALNNAKGIFKDWIKKYQDPEIIRSFLNTTNEQYISNFGKINNADNFQIVDRILSETNAGSQLSKYNKKVLVDETLEKFTRNPTGTNPKDFKKALLDLSPILEPAEIQALEEGYNSARKVAEQMPANPTAPQKPKLEKVPKLELPEKPEKVQVKEHTKAITIPIKKEPKLPKKPEKPEQKFITQEEIAQKNTAPETPQMKAAAKKMNMQTGEVMRLADSPDGINQLRDTLSTSEPGKKMFAYIGQNKMNELMQGNTIIYKYKGSDLGKVMNHKDNFQIFSQFLGEQEAQELLQAALKIGDKKITPQTMKTMIKHAATWKALSLFGLI